VLFGFLHLEQSGVPGVSAENRHAPWVKKLMLTSLRKSRRPFQQRESVLTTIAGIFYAMSQYVVWALKTLRVSDAFQANPELMLSENKIRLGILHQI